MIELRDVEFSYDGVRPALVVPSLDIGTGLTMVVGPNGSGKSTLLRIAAGVERPRRGTVLVEGHDLWRDEVAARRSLAFVPEHPELTPYASIADVLQLVARLRGATYEDVANALDRVGLLDVAWHTVRELSMGQRRRALFATALLGDPKVVILDEPLETMDQAMRDLITGWVRDHRSAGATILLATHDLEPFAPHVDSVIVAREGTVRVVPSTELDATQYVTTAPATPRRPLR
jgi:ABC-type multidrug transport system ATPase subunit